MAFLLKRYEVLVAGYGAAFFYAKNKSQARARAFRAMQSANAAITFKRFLQMRPAITEVKMPPGFGREIEVSGKPAHWVEHAGGNSVRFAYPDSDTILLTHEADVREPEPEDPCPLCGCEERGQGGYLACECPDI